ncbi:MAG: hypothetical protein LUG24_03985 [Clostridiales bacterium]|nr:hypothetical protein [Clostridiales bacterium]
MTAVKERIFGAITIMNNCDAEKLWHIIETNFCNHDWDDIEEVEPDEWDLQMLSEIESDPDCKEFVSEEELQKIL